MSARIIEIEELGYKIGDDASATTVSCIGTVTYTVNSITKRKKCGASEVPVATINTGSGKVTIEAHSDNDDYEEMLGMANTTAKGAENKQGARRPSVCITAKGKDEDGNVVLIAVPKAMITQDETSFSVDNAGTEIAYLSQEFEYSPDADKIGLYIKDADDLPSSITASSWMSNFNASTMYK